MKFFKRCTVFKDCNNNYGELFPPIYKKTNLKSVEDKINELKNRIDKLENDLKKYKKAL